MLNNRLIALFILTDKKTMTPKETCLSKIAYAKEDRAWKEAYFYYNVTGTKTGVYKCYICHLFHLSKKVKKEIPESIKLDKVLNKRIRRVILLRKIPKWLQNLYGVYVKVINFRYRKTFKRLKQHFREKYEQTKSFFTRKYKRLTPKRKFKDETLSHEEMKKVIASLKSYPQDKT